MSPSYLPEHAPTIALIAYQTQEVGQPREARSDIESEVRKAIARASAAAAGGDRETREGR